MDARGIIKDRQVRHTSAALMKHEIRLALPTNEDLSNFAGAFENGFSMPKFNRAMRRTAREFASEAAVPFLGVGAASVGAGIAAGIAANTLEKRRPEKNGDVIKEGVFQYVANIAMCGFGAGAGLTVANTMGMTKFRNPIGRLGVIVAGLAGGIVAGATLANPLSNTLESFIERRTRKGEPAPAHISGRKLEGADCLLHVDDVPTAFSVAGVQALKPWLPPFFLMSGIKTAYGYRNVEPVAHMSPIPVGKRMPLQLSDTSPASVNEQEDSLMLPYKISPLSTSLNRPVK
jgi:MFS family permease